MAAAAMAERRRRSVVVKSSQRSAIKKVGLCRKGDSNGNTVLAEAGL